MVYIREHHMISEQVIHFKLYNTIRGRMHQTQLKVPYVSRIQCNVKQKYRVFNAKCIRKKLYN